MFKRVEIALAVGMLTSVLMGSFGAFAAECVEVRGEVLRLHVLACSDSEEDQRIKLAVRDAVLNRANELMSESGADKESVKTAARQHLAELESAAEEAVRACGSDDSVRASVVNMYFGTREYEGFTLPAGMYDAVRVEVGRGEGRNWWCVMFPPMCVPAASDTQGAELTKKILDLNTRPAYRPKLAVVELFERLLE